MEIESATGKKHINKARRFRMDVEGIYPQMCKYLFERRTVLQKRARELEKEKGKDDFEYKSYAYKSDNQKQVLNSIFGVGSFKNFELFSPFTAAGITSLGRKMITFVDEYCKKKGYLPIMGDTDSLGVQIPKDVDEEEFTKELNDAVKNYVITNWPKTKDRYVMNFEFQKTYKAFIMKESKKRYFGLDKKTSEFMVKGFPIVQHSTPIFVKAVLTDVFIDFLTIGIDPTYKVSHNLCVSSPFPGGHTTKS
jgi:DNA polymerase elongation subunit (family B)